jgi:hypothetical protein
VHCIYDFAWPSRTQGTKQVMVGDLGLQLRSRRVRSLRQSICDEVAELTATGLKPTRNSLASPWQSGVAGWIGSCRRELLDHVIIL